MTVIRGLSFRSQIMGELHDFLLDERITCANTTSALVTIVAELANYTEEGEALTPDVYVCENVEQFTDVIPGVQIERLGEGPRSDETARKVLKDCAPLAREYWAIFIERSDGLFRYGIFSSPLLPLAMMPSESLLDARGDVCGILARQVGPSCVEVVGAQGNQRRLYFSAVRAEHPAPHAALGQLTQAIVRDIDDDESAERTSRFLLRAITRAVRRSHGTLIAVLPNDGAHVPVSMASMLRLPTAMSAVELVDNYERNRNDENFDRLLAFSELLVGMISSDGIVVFTTNGALLGYRCTFAHDPDNEEALAAVVGGHRHMAYHAMTHLIGEGLSAVYIRSHDGGSDFAGEDQA